MWRNDGNPKSAYVTRFAAVVGLLAGCWFAYFSLVVSLLVAWYVHDSNAAARITTAVSAK